MFNKKLVIAVGIILLIALPIILGQIANRQDPRSRATASATKNVKDYGAKGDGVTSDQQAFQKALEDLKALGGGKLIIPEGTYIFEHRVKGAIVVLTGLSNVELAGAGREKTVIKLKPGVDYSKGQGLGDPHLMQFDNGTNLHFHDIAFDGSRFEILGKQEQMHALYFKNSMNIVIENAFFKNLVGDGVFLLGNGPCPSCKTDGVTVQNSNFYENGRSGIVIQRDVHKVRILNNVFEKTNDQDIDMEPTGNEPSPDDIIIKNNIFKHTGKAYSVTIDGSGPNYTDPTNKPIIVADNDFQGTGIITFKVINVEISGNTIKSLNPVEPPIEIIRKSHTIKIINNKIEGISERGVITVKGLGNEANATDNITIQGNSLLQKFSGGSGIVFQDNVGDNTVIKENQITGLTDNAQKKTYGIRIDTPRTPRKNYSIDKNEIKNFSTGIEFPTSPKDIPISDVSITSNYVYSGNNPVSVLLFRVNSTQTVLNTDTISNLIVRDNVNGPAPTRTPTPTVSTPTPTSTPSVPTPTTAVTSLTPTLPPGTGTPLSLNITLHGVGNGGDNSNPGNSSGSNKNPKKTTLAAKALVYNQSNKLISEATGTVTYNPSSGNYTGVVKAPILIPVGSYIVKLKTSNRLLRLVPGIQTISLSKPLTLPSVALIAGDANNNNSLDIDDYNIILDCYATELTPAKNCTDPNKKSATDLNDDGLVNLTDLNLFLREMSKQIGE